ncbi:MAG: DNA (cytosine-5-)-methyltransferase [Anaerolineaceae bacterium]|jgi:DNA (cytosine-5)-methyltransferase 1|nr:DNA (cytosine-5-)-methyltransferase [Anaerolineaceae bacterium]
MTIKQQDTTHTFRLGELFCGPGGIGLAAKWAKINKDSETFNIVHSWATDYDKDTCETYRRNLSPDNPKSVVCHDIRKLDYEVLANISDIDGLAFGFPCNDFSMVGEQKGINGVFGPLYTYGVKALKKFKPKWFLAENVGGLRNSNEGNAFQTILEELNTAGYVITPHLYKFEEYGVPQARHRIIIIGIRTDIDVQFRVPSPLPYADIDVSCQNAIMNPPIPFNALNQEYTNHAPTVVERLKHIKPGENAFTANLPEHLQLNVKGARISQIYKRLDPNKPAYTVTGSGGGGTHVYHWSENRALTNRERARLQTFPDDFEFIGSKESVRKQIGMAVPAKGAQIIFEALLKSFAGIDYLSTEPNISYSYRLLEPVGQYTIEGK